jgi:integrase
VWIKAREDAFELLTPREARRTAASYMAAARLTPKAAQEAMGRADIRTTLNIYAKAVPGWQEQGRGEARRLPGRRQRGSLPRTGFARQSRDSRGPKPSGRERFPSG